MTAGAKVANSAGKDKIIAMPNRNAAKNTGLDAGRPAELEVNV